MASAPCGTRSPRHQRLQRVPAPTCRQFRATARAAAAVPAEQAAEAARQARSDCTKPCPCEPITWHFAHCAGMRTGTLRGILIVAAATAVSMACGTYRHDKTIHNVIATGWDDRGGVVSLAEVIRLRWDFWGINPPHTNPKTWVERRGQVVRQGTVVTPVSHLLGDWPDAYARQDGRGFVVTNGGDGCRLVTLTGGVTDCPFEANDKRVVYFLP